MLVWAKWPQLAWYLVLTSMYIYSLLNCSLLHTGILFIRTHCYYLGTLLDPGKLLVSVHGRLPVLLHTTRYCMTANMHQPAKANHRSTWIALNPTITKKPKANNRIFSPALEMAKFALAAIVLLTAGKQAIWVVLLCSRKMCLVVVSQFCCWFLHKFHFVQLINLFCITFAGTVSAFTGTQLKSTAFGVSRSSTSLSMSTIKAIKAREILDSRGNPTVEVSRLQTFYRL